MAKSPLCAPYMNWMLRIFHRLIPMVYYKTSFSEQNYYKTSHAAFAAAMRCLVCERERKIKYIYKLLIQPVSLSLCARLLQKISSLFVQSSSVQPHNPIKNNFLHFTDYKLQQSRRLCARRAHIHTYILAARTWEKMLFGSQPRGAAQKTQK